MERREFIVSSVVGTLGVGAGDLALAATDVVPMQPASTRKILIAGGGFGTTFIKDLASLTGKARPTLCYLPTAGPDSDAQRVRWYENCAPLDVVPSV